MDFETKLQEEIIKIGVDIAQKGEGALFVISDNVKYKTMLKQKIQPFNVLEPGAKKILLSIGMIDGAVIVNKRGIVMDYGALIKSKKVVQGYGTRHSAAVSASMYPESTAILVSQEEKKVKIFKQQKLILQIDALEKNVKERISQANHILESVGVGTLASIGVATLTPIGIAVVPGIIVFGAPYYLYKKLTSKE